MRELFKNFLFAVIELKTVGVAAVSVFLRPNQNFTTSFTATTATTTTIKTTTTTIIKTKTTTAAATTTILFPIPLFCRKQKQTNKTFLRTRVRSDDKLFLENFFSNLAFFPDWVYLTLLSVQAAWKWWWYSGGTVVEQWHSVWTGRV